ncbi:Bug family tripartite tricarboxylate transporter substrate binding protein [Roseomonas sp. CCTCC AB2023176]|uniref:Bug family tripartite tricarboxylate transporter substrate binding protein n=1 Tax=Roseomonas sp. CCTCC AB2023176 TaxID=3342640 RepID=UPI0035E2E74C
MRRRTILAATLAAPALRAQPAWSPSKPVSFVNGFAPGSTIDLVARLVAREMEPRLGQPVIVDSRPGASGNIAMQQVLRQPADGHTIGFAAITLGTNPHLMNVGYDPVRDIQIVSRISTVPVAVVVSTRAPFSTLPELIAYGRANREGITLGHGGAGTSGFLAAQLLARAAGFVPLMVPYTGSGPVYQAMLAGTLHGTVTPVDNTLPGQVSGGAMRVLAVMQDSRIAMFPDVPTTRELGFGPEVDFRSWHGVMARPDTPSPALETLFRAVVGAVGTASVREGLLRAGVEPAPSASVADAQSYYLGELDRWGQLIRAIGLRPS